MGEGSIVAVFLILLTSYAIAWYSAPGSRDTQVEEHLFGGNTPLLGLSSSVGAIVSMAVAFTALLSAGFVFGWQILFSVAVGGAAGLKVLVTFVRRPMTASLLDHAAQLRYRHGASYLAVLASGRSNGFLLFYVVALVFYQGMLATELAVLRSFLHFFIPMSSAELGVLLAVIVIVCYSYVFLGGFRGVLTTDYFQLLIVVVFIALIAALFVRMHLPFYVPSMTVAAVSWTPLRLILLHIGVLIAAFAWGLANTDQWYRTVGTLPVKAATSTLKLAGMITFILAIPPILTGSAAAATLPHELGNTASLHLLSNLWSYGDVTLRFVMIMALTCAALTTLNTYIITTEQLYYEFSIRMIANTQRQYILEFLFKWKQIRAVALVALAIAYSTSFLISARMIYAVGALSACGFIFFVPAVIAATVRSSVKSMRSNRDVQVLITSLVLAPVVLVFASYLAGDVTTHLYLFPASVGIACAIASTGYLRRP